MDTWQLFSDPDDEEDDDGDDGTDEIDDEGADVDDDTCPKKLENIWVEKGKRGRKGRC